MDAVVPAGWGRQGAALQPDGASEHLDPGRQHNAKRTSAYRLSQQEIAGIPQRNAIWSSVLLGTSPLAEKGG